MSTDAAIDAEEPHGPTLMRRTAVWGVIVGVGGSIWLVDSAFDARPAGIEPWGWRLLAIFVPTILALMLRPIPGGAAVLAALVLAVACDALPEEFNERGERIPPMAHALRGYMDSTVWLVLAAYMISRGLIKTGLARRIALGFIRLLGGSSLGLSYAILASDTVLAAMIPSNAARVGGVLLPIVRNLAEFYRSHPGRTAGLLGSFLMLALYQGDVIACALFYTGQASNPLAAKIAFDITGGEVQLGYLNWFLYALLPAAVCLLLVPWIVFRLHRPEITHTPEAPRLAAVELRRMGRPSGSEMIVALVFVGVCGLWVHAGIEKEWWARFGRSADQTALIALGGVTVLLLSGVLTWRDLIAERGAWDVFIWYGGLVQLGTLLHRANVTTVFAHWVAANVQGWHVALLFLAVLLIYFYAHYAFASITAHILSMYPAFVGVLLSPDIDMPPWLAACVFAYASNFCAGLTHYGTTPAPIVFSVGYVTHGEWWRIGLILSVVNLSVWLTVGMGWWKLWGLW